MMNYPRRAFTELTTEKGPLTLPISSRKSPSGRVSALTVSHSDGKSSDATGAGQVPDFDFSAKGPALKRLLPSGNPLLFPSEHFCLMLVSGKHSRFEQLAKVVGTYATITSSSLSRPVIVLLQSL